MRKIRMILAMAVLIMPVLNAQNNNSIDINDLSGQQNNPIITAVPFLSIAPDSRAGGMGEVGAATSPDVNSQYWNAAKYNFLEQSMGLGISYSPWLRSLGLDDINLYYLSGYVKLDPRQTISGGLRYFSLGEITFTNFEGTPQGNYNPNEWAISAGYGLKLSDYFAGSISFRFIYSNLTSGYSEDLTPGIAGAADIGFYYQRPIEIQDKDAELAFGLNISNIGNKISYSENQPSDFLPTNLRLGGRLTYDMDEYNSMTVAIDLNKYLVPSPPQYFNDDGSAGTRQDYDYLIGKDPDVSVPLGILQSFYDAPRGLEEELEEIIYNFGLEYWYRDQFAIRGGYFHENTFKGNRKFATLGAGFKLNVVGIDFSYLIPVGNRTSPLANTVRFTIALDFDALMQSNAF